MTDEQRYSRYAEMKRGTHNKFYEVKVEETESGSYRLTFTYGRIGTEGRALDQGLHTSYSYAKQRADEQFDKKLDKDYVEVTAMQALASAVETLEERQTNGLSAVEIVIPRFHAGKSEKRCVTFAQKWIDKLNLVRASRWEFDSDAYRRQADGVLKGYCKEWKRICGTQAHGALADNSAAQTAFRMIFASLKDDAGITLYGYYNRMLIVS